MKALLLADDGDIKRPQKSPYSPEAIHTERLRPSLILPGEQMQTDSCPYAFWPPLHLYKHLVLDQFE
jgi:hypothetical protein